MAVAGKIIRNPKTKQEIRFLKTAKDTDGQLLEMETTYGAHSKEPPSHYHPFQVEDFTVVSGSLTVRMDGELKQLRAGEALHIPRNRIHSMWNESTEPATLHWKVQPALETEYFLENAMGLANEGKTNDEGMPGLLQAALLVTRYTNTFRLAKPPFPVQKILFLILTPIAFLLGYKPGYKKYLD